MMIGCDPEFVYYNLADGKFCPAHRLTQSNSDLGCDGHSDTGEMRPAAKSTAKEVVSQIASLFEEGEKFSNIKKHGILAGHYKFNKTIGGHIHISGFNMDMREFAMLLDNLFEPLSDIIDEIMERGLRRGNGYGSGFRSQGDNWIEYRTPGSWLLSPAVTYLNLGLAEAIGYAYQNFVNTGDYSLLEMIYHPKTKQEKMSMLLKFVKTHTFPDQELLGTVMENVFSAVPLDWNRNIKEFWLQ